MKLKESLEKLFITFQNDKKLMRLLHYMPKNASDDPLSDKKKDVQCLPDFDTIVSKVMIPSDKTYDLVLKTNICRICFYTGTRQLQKANNAYKGRQHDNVYIADQVYNFDVYVHVDIDIIDFRKDWICDAINELLNDKTITDIGTFRLAFSSPINNTPDGFIGYKMAYITNSVQ